MDRQRTTSDPASFRKLIDTQTCFDWHVPTVDDLKALSKIYGEAEHAALVRDLAKAKAAAAARGPDAPLRNKNPEINARFARMQAGARRLDRQEILAIENQLRTHDAYRAFVTCATVYLVEDR